MLFNYFYCTLLLECQLQWYIPWLVWLLHTALVGVIIIFWVYTELYTQLALMSIWYHIWRIIFVGANFHGKSEEALKINFCGFKFRDSNQSRGMTLHDTRARSRSQSSLLLSHTYRDLDIHLLIAWDRRKLVSKTPSAGWQWLLLLASTGKCWPHCHDVCGHAHHHGLT